jgi:hypothetical protein
MGLPLKVLGKVLAAYRARSAAETGDWRRTTPSAPTQDERHQAAEESQRGGFRDRRAGGPEVRHAELALPDGEVVAV